VDLAPLVRLADAESRSRAQPSEGAPDRVGLAALGYLVQCFESSNHIERGERLDCFGARAPRNDDKRHCEPKAKQSRAARGCGRFHGITRLVGEGRAPLRPERAENFARTAGLLDVVASVLQWRVQVDLCWEEADDKADLSGRLHVGKL
jgi:hypothetical protein